MFVDGAWYWALSEREREDSYILTDTDCLLCGDSLEGHSFVQWYFHGPQLDIAGMHLPCAHTMCLGLLKDLATAGDLPPESLLPALAAWQPRPRDHESEDRGHNA